MVITNGYMLFTVDQLLAESKFIFLSLGIAHLSIYT